MNRFSLWVGLSLLVVMSALALLTPYLGLADPRAIMLSQEFAPPSATNWLGRGENGVDLLSQVLWGSRLSLSVGFATVIISALIGLILGSFAGYVMGWFDTVLMRVIDVVYAFPGILLNVSLAAFLGPSVQNMMIALIATSWAGYARLVRGVALSLREREFVSAAQALGGQRLHIVIKHLWPNLLAPLIVQMTFGLGGVIMVESSLSFLGLGVPPGTPSWGQLLNQGRDVLTSAPHAVFIPGGALVITILGLNLLGDGLRDLIDPKTRK